ncbi:hypothetical protein F4803DRAFT_554595 [Xylaria telfairii]|nr:hypothetical protein F4803DRAFT_554595 [Xylaria telfairii]
MPPENRQYTPMQRQPFHVTLTELSARLAILNVNDRQQKDPSGSIDGRSVIKQFEPSSGLISDFAKVFDVPLPDVLWAFSLIFSPSRDGSCVVASVLREKPQNQDPRRSLFTLYLMINKGSWSSNDKKYSQKWQDAVNSAINENMSDFSDLWSSLTQNCKKRIEDYVESAKRNMFGVMKEPKMQNPQLVQNCTKTFENIATLARSACPSGFYVALNQLLGRIKRDTGPDPEKDLASLTEECWKFLKKHGDDFQDLFACLPKRRTASEHTDSLGLRYPERARLFLQTIENFAKLPRAFNTYLKFRGVLVSSKSRLEIELLDYSLIAQGDGLPMLSISSVMGMISKLTTTNVEDAKDVVRDSEGNNPHCEIQMLEYMDKMKKKSGIWNVIGSSKRQCLACAGLLRESDFLFKESHGKAYFQQFISNGRWLRDNKEMRSAIEKLNAELSKSVRENNFEEQEKKMESVQKKYNEPDSPIRQDWSPDTIRNLDLSKECDLSHPENI